jgi:O-antigen/teichoic acid export membrane protein
MNTLKQKIHILLRWSEKYTKTDMVYLASGNLWLSIKKILAVVITFGLSVAFANLLPQEVFGQYKYVFSLVGILSIPTLLGMGNSVTRAVARGYDGTPLLSITTKIRWGFLGSLAGIAVSVYYFTQGNIDLALAFIVVALFIPFVDTFSSFNTILTGKQLFKVSILYEIGVQFTFALSMTLALFLTDNLFILLLTYFAIYTLTRFIVLRIVMRRYLENTKVDHSAITYGKHLSVMSVLDTIAGAIDNVLLWHFLGATSVAIFAFTKALPNQMEVFLKNITTLAFPKFARRDFESTKKTLWRKMLGLTGLTIIGIIGYIILAPYVYKLFFPQYLDAIFYSQVFVLVLIFFPKKIMGTVLNAHAETKKLYIYSTSSPFIKVGLSFLLIPQYGIMGAVYAEIGLRAFSLLLMTILFTQTQIQKITS